MARASADVLVLAAMVVGASVIVVSAQNRDQSIEARRNAWYRAQVAQDCVRKPYDQTAINAVIAVYQGKGRLLSDKDPNGRKASALNNLRTRQNPKGEGIVVTAWKDNNRGASADYSRERSAWLVVGGRVYPVNAKAANDLGYLYDGMPETIQRRAGLVHSYQRGRTMMDQLGLEEYTYERRFSGGNPFPRCD